MDAAVLTFPAERRDVPFSHPRDNPHDLSVTRLPRARRSVTEEWAQPLRTAEMELILCLIARLKMHKGFSRIGTEVLHDLHDAMQERRLDPSLHVAVNALCSGAY